MKADLGLSKVRLAPRIVFVVLLTMAMTLLLDLAIGMALRSTGPTLVDEQSLLQEAMSLSVAVAALPPEQREETVRKAASSRRIDFALLRIDERRDALPLAGLIDTMRKRLAERTEQPNGAYAVSMNFLPAGPGRRLRQVTVVVPTPGAERGEILSVAAARSTGGYYVAHTLPAIPAGTVVGRFEPAFSATHPAPDESVAARDYSQTVILDTATLPANIEGLPAAVPTTPLMRTAPMSPPLTHVRAPPAMQSVLTQLAAPHLGADFLENLHVDPAVPRISVALELADGQWLIASPGKPNPVWLRQLLKLSGVILLLVAVAMLSIRTARSFVQPLTQLSMAAERLGREREPTPIAAMSIPEYAAIAQKFNEMQVRLKRFVDDRTEQLAAISHDLRTPLTRMRLVAEYVEDSPREQLLADISQMETMIAGFLAFAGEDASMEPHQSVDIAALLISLCDDIADRGGDADYQGPDHAYLPCQPIAMRRALANLIDNGCRYGDRVRVSLSLADTALRITIDDDGPGIAPEHHELAFTPFQRLNHTRGRHAAGSGLGLSIARGVVRGHGGEVQLAAAASGGLRVEIDLPVPA
ncbi:ATP-binding protein [Pseudomonas sp. CGJS7]|uniref:ATP-binding protein n=1 Tax=Pseudomonas sp. CGJS7 TaxID=3109348 RepID=UPI00300BDD48